MSEGSFVEFLERFVDERLQDIQISVPAQIVIFTASTMRATVKPLLIRKNSQGFPSPLPNLLDVPVSFLHAGGYWIKPPYMPSDLVLLSFSTHDIKLALKGMPDQYSDKIFSLENSFVVGGYTRDGAVLPPSISEIPGITFADKTGTTVMNFQTGVGLRVSNSGGALWVNVLTHIHPTAVPGPPSPPTPTP